MAPNVLYLEPGTRATGDTTLYALTAGAVLSDVLMPFTGQRTLRLVMIGTTTASAFFGGPVDTGAISFNIRFEDTVYADSLCFALYDASLNQVYTLFLTAGGNLKSQPVGATAVTGTQGIEPGVWYRFCLSYVITNTTTFSFKLYVNGKLDTTATAGTMTRTGTALGVFACAAASQKNGRSIWTDNIYVDDRSDQSDTGDVFLLERRPVANGSLNDFTTQVGSVGSGYGSGHAPLVNEIPLNAANGWSVASAGSKTEEYNIEGPPLELTGGATLIDCMGWIRALAGAAETGSIICDGASSAIALTTSAKSFAKMGQKRYPPRTGTDIGISNDGTATSVTLLEAGVIVAYKNPPELVDRNRLLLNRADGHQPW